jgi:N,N'-diacetyllegionaminate synthase
MKNKVFIIAEAGVNHNGNLDLALKLCDIAKNAGADAVKFQTLNAELNVLKQCEMAEYQKKHVKTKSHWQMIKDLELSREEFRKIKERCDSIGIEFLSTPCVAEDLGFLIYLGMKRIKVSSGEITNVPLLSKIGKLKKEVILSTGMSELKEIKNAIDILVKSGTIKSKITALQCNSEYPTPMSDVNLKAMLTIRDAFNVKVGYSDHTIGIEVPIAAVAMGATIIEKHFTIDKNMPGPDHKASLEPLELKAMVTAIRNIEKALGSTIKKPTKSEIKNRKICRKTIVAVRSIRKGEIFTEENITVKRPQIGLSSIEWNKVLGKKANKNFIKDDPISL